MGKTEITTSHLEEEKGVPEEMADQVIQVKLSELHPFEGHPFKVLDDETMENTVESIKQIGIAVPLLVRPDPYGGYEIISGHRRQRAAELAGLDTVPVIVKDLDDDAAIILMVDSNIQRENLLPSERAWAYKLKLDAMKHQAGRPLKENSSQVGNNIGKLSSEELAQEVGTSRNQIDMVDEKQIAFNPAVELSYLKPKEQREFLLAMESAQTAPSLSQAQRLKKLSQEGNCTLSVMCDIMNEVKKDEWDHVTIKNDVLRKYFPKSYTPKQMEDTIIRLLDQWQRRKQRDVNR